jgi:hypothetical protein
MDYDELVAKVIELLQREKRIPYRSLKRRFDVDDEYIEDLKIDLTEAIYATMKTAYNIRSKTVHGDKLSSKDVERATELSTACDNFLRQTLIKIWSSQRLVELFSGKKEALDEHFMSLTFGGGESETNASST